MIYFENGSSVTIEHKEDFSVGSSFLCYVDIHGNVINVNHSKITHILKCKDHEALCELLPV